MLDIKKLNEDKRGEMYQILHNGREYILFTIKKGYARGGDYHKTEQYDVVLEGVIDYRRVEPDGQEFRKTLSKNDTIVSPKGQPHIFIALTDSLILEWTGLGKFQKEIYQPYRDIINAKM